MLLSGNYFRLFPSTPKEFGLFPFPPLLFPRYPIHYPLTIAILLSLNPLNPSDTSTAIGTGAARDGHCWRTAGGASVPRPEGAGLLGTEPEISEPVLSPEHFRTGTAPGGRLCLPPGAGSVRAVDACRLRCWGGVERSGSPQAVCRRLGAHSGMGCWRDVFSLRAYPKTGQCRQTMKAQARWSKAI